LIVVIDTNALVSSLLTPAGHANQIVSLASSGRVTPAFDDRILHEYAEVLRRRKFPFHPTQVEALLVAIRHFGRRSRTSVRIADLPDPNDAMFLEVALAAGADCLVTGNLRHFPARSRRGVRVVNPKQFIDRLRA